jgi:hypothetical protein
MERLDLGSATPRSPSRRRPRHRARRVAATLGVSVVALMVGRVAAPVGAAPVSVSTDPSGAHVRLARGGTWVEVRAPRSGDGDGGSGPRASGCLRRWVPTAYPIYLRRTGLPNDGRVVPMPPRPGPGYLAYYVYCDDTYVTSV